MTKKNITFWIKYFIKIFPSLTKEESDMISDILKWDDEKRSGFLLAKKIFEDENEFE